MIYAIIPFQEGPEFEAQIRSVDSRAYRIESPKMYLVSFKGTTLEVSRTMGYGGDKPDVGTGLVLPVSNYHGFAPKDLWEWLEGRQNGE